MSSHHETRHLTHFYRLAEAGANFTFFSVDDELARLIFLQVFENRQSLTAIFYFCEQEQNRILKHRSILRVKFVRRKDVLIFVNYSIQALSISFHCVVLKAISVLLRQTKV